MFTTFTFDNAVKYKQALLRFTSLGNEVSQDTGDIISYTSYMLEVPDNTFHSLAKKIGDSSDFNKMRAN